MFGSVGVEKRDQKDPPPPAARQSSSSSSSVDPLLRPSSNSAFEKYIPSTADINTKMNAGFPSEGRRGSVGVVSPFNAAPNTSSTTDNSGSSNRASAESGRLGLGKTSIRCEIDFFHCQILNKKCSLSIFSGLLSKSPKVARFCHECGNPFALPDIRFCCECGVKRLYC